MTRSLITDAQNTWCPGCGNFAIQHAIKEVLSSLEEEGRPLEEVVLVAGIGCHGKIADYLNINTFYAIHGRTIPVATGIKLAHPDLTVICCAGDGDAFAEGLDHLLFAAKRNIDLTCIIHDNRVYGLTTGQYTPTSPLHFKGRSTPQGTIEPPFNPLELLFASGATHIARGYTKNLPLLKKLIREGILHKGFSFIDILQICASFFDMTDEYKRRVYMLENHDPADPVTAFQMIQEWDYNLPAPISLGTFYKRESERFDTFFKFEGQTDKERQESLIHLIKDMW
jgi:2-oxoglutarate ferredoxin oxidoreductase subunit beta